MLDTGLEPFTCEWRQTLAGSCVALRDRRPCCVLLALGLADSDGLGSLDFLERFPVDVIRINLTFVAGLGANAQNTDLVTTTVTLGHNLQLTVVAESKPRTCSPFSSTCAATSFKAYTSANRAPPSGFPTSSPASAWQRPAGTASILSASGLDTSFEASRTAAAAGGRTGDPTESSRPRSVTAPRTASVCRAASVRSWTHSTVDGWQSNPRRAGPPCLRPLWGLPRRGRNSTANVPGGAPTVIKVGEQRRVPKWWTARR